VKARPLAWPASADNMTAIDLLKAPLVRPSGTPTPEWLVGLELTVIYKTYRKPR
jgi:hypothetical protein